MRHIAGVEKRYIMTFRDDESFLETCFDFHVYFFDGVKFYHVTDIKQYRPATPEYPLMANYDCPFHRPDFRVGVDIDRTFEDSLQDEFAKRVPQGFKCVGFECLPLV